MYSTVGSCGDQVLKGMCPPSSPFRLTTAVSQAHPTSTGTVLLRYLLSLAESRIAPQQTAVHVRAPHAADEIGEIRGRAGDADLTNHHVVLNAIAS
jgi:hypothetical protein